MIIRPDCDNYVEHIDVISDLEYGDPSEADVVERYSAVKRVLAARLTLGVVLVPVDAAGLGWHRRVSEVPRQLDVAGR